MSSTVRSVVTGDDIRPPNMGKRPDRFRSAGALHESTDRIAHRVKEGKHRWLPRSVTALSASFAWMCQAPFTISARTTFVAAQRRQVEAGMLPRATKTLIGR